MKEKKFDELKDGDLIKLKIEYREDSMQVYRDNKHYFDDTVMLVKDKKEDDFFYITSKEDGFSHYWKENEITCYPYSFELKYDKTEDEMILDMDDMAKDWCHVWSVKGNTIEVLDDPTEIINHLKDAIKILNKKYVKLFKDYCELQDKNSDMEENEAEAESSVEKKKNKGVEKI